MPRAQQVARWKEQSGHAGLESLVFPLAACPPAQADLTP